MPANLKNLAVLAFCLIASCLRNEAAQPPFPGTIFIDPDIVTPADPTSFFEIRDKGRGLREMFDRRINDWVVLNAILFEAKFDDGSLMEVQVNPEFGTSSEALAVARKYLPAIGQIPGGLRKEVQTIWIHQGREAFGGGNNNILIHDLQGDDYIRDGILEEALMHEATHSSLYAIYPSTLWLGAQESDPNFISQYAKDNPAREDMAETIVSYFAIRYRRDRISETMRQTIEAAIPNRIAYLDSLNLDMSPQVAKPLVLNAGKTANELSIHWTARLGKNYQVQYSNDLVSWQNYQSPITATELQTKASVSFEVFQAGFFRIVQLN